MQNGCEDVQIACKNASLISMDGPLSINSTCEKSEEIGLNVIKAGIPQANEHKWNQPPIYKD